MKRVLIISPCLPPINAADMQRVRMSLPYFEDCGWVAEVVTVDPQYVDMVKDDLLLKSVPPDIKIHTVKAFDKKWTSKLGLGSIALRSLWFYKQKVNALLKEQKFDLIYFSTTQFPVSILGAYWKKRFNIPYVIDMQDPWHSEYYRNKPKAEQPSKYWFSYRLNKTLEPIAVKHVGGLISVSVSYIEDLKNRYPQIKDIPSSVITFGAFEPDFKIAAENADKFNPLLDPGFTNLVYIGRGGYDMQRAIDFLFKAFKAGMKTDANNFQSIKMYFIGTSYAPAGGGKQTIMPLAKQYGIENNVIEITDRISYYHTLATLNQADALFIPGSDDPKYTASKIYPYLLAKKPLLTIFHENSSANNVLRTCCDNASVQTFPTREGEITSNITGFLTGLAKKELPAVILKDEFDRYSAAAMTEAQIALFNKVLTKK
ncbi:glycosyltransferase family protein [Mucilaginibacter mallensis]|nr:hypothetical protein [Mucilaginibacter mallensis]